MLKFTGTQISIVYLCMIIIIFYGVSHNNYIFDDDNCLLN